MRLSQRDLRAVRIARAAAHTGALGGRTRAFGEASLARAQIAPLAQTLSALAAGEWTETGIELIFQGEAPLSAGDGAWLPGEGQDAPPWLCTGVRQYAGHAVARLERSAP